MYEWLSSAYEASPNWEIYKDLRQLLTYRGGSAIIVEPLFFQGSSTDPAVVSSLGCCAYIKSGRGSKWVSFERPIFICYLMPLFRLLGCLDMHQSKFIPKTASCYASQELQFKFSNCLGSITVAPAGRPAQGSLYVHWQNSIADVAARRVVPDDDAPPKKVRPITIPTPLQVFVNTCKT